MYTSYGFFCKKYYAKNNNIYAVMVSTNTWKTIKLYFITFRKSSFISKHIVKAVVFKRLMAEYFMYSVNTIKNILIDDHKTTK